MFLFKRLSIEINLFEVFFNIPLCIPCFLSSLTSFQDECTNLIFLFLYVAKLLNVLILFFNLRFKLIFCLSFLNAYIVGSIEYICALLKFWANGNDTEPIFAPISTIKDFSLIAPFAKEKNFGYFQENKKIKNKNLLEVDYVKGFAMLFNTKKIKKFKMFDENIFLYLEEIDLCKRLRKKNHKIYVCKNAKIFHIGAKSSNLGFEYEKCRNWHWMWSRVYFDKKHFGTFYAVNKYFFQIIKDIFKLIIFSMMLNRKKVFISYLRLSGVFNSLLGNSSWYRPKIN